MKAVLGFDIGTSSTKVIAVSPEGEVLASSAAPVRAQASGQGRLEEQPEEWWGALVKALGSIRSALPKEIDIQGIGLSGHMSGLVLLDADGRPVRPCILLADTRGAKEAAALEAGVRSKIVEQTGNRLSEAFTLAKLLWVKKHEAAAFRKARWAVSAKDYILSRLTGTVATEPTDAGNYLLLDRDASRWDTSLMEAIGLPVELFPPLRSSVEEAGELTAAAARETGLSAGIPVVAGGADMACAAVGSGTIAEGDVAMSLGTASPVIAPVSRIDRTLVGKFTFHPHAMAGSRYALASILSGGRSYQWLADLLRQAGADRIDFVTLDRHAARSSPGAGGVLFLPFLTGTGSPDWRRSGRAAWLGIGASTGLPELARAVMEGVAYNCRECLELYARSEDSTGARGNPLSRIVVSGGGAGSSLWPEILADVTGLPVQALATREASALGAAVLAGVGCGAFGGIPEAVTGMTRLGQSIEPDSRGAEAYDRHYQAWRLAERQLTSVDDALAGAGPGGRPA